MVVFYNIETKEIAMVEHDVMFPTLPANMTEEEITKFYKEEEKMAFISIPESEKPNGDVFGYGIIFDDKGEFKELKLKEGLNG